MKENLHHIDFSSLVNLAIRGGLAHPTPFCCAVSKLVHQHYSHISRNEYWRGKLSERRHHRGIFIAAVSEKITEFN